MYHFGLGWERERGRDSSIHTFTTELSPGEMEPRKGGVDGLTRIKWCVKKSHGNPFINSLISNYNFKKERERESLMELPCMGGHCLSQKTWAVK